MEHFYRTVTYEEIRKNKEIGAYIEAANGVLGAIGFTEHGLPHVCRAAGVAANLLRELGFEERTCELAAIAGYLHDIGNTVNRVDHAQSGALMAFYILSRLGMPPEEVAVVASAIGHHDEGTAAPVNEVAAALILADKSDVRRSRVRNKSGIMTDIHDRVNYAVERTELQVRREEKAVLLQMSIDTAICPVMDYFEIFLSRMLLCRKAADSLGLTFELVINQSRML